MVLLFRCFETTRRPLGSSCAAMRTYSEPPQISGPVAACAGVAIPPTRRAVARAVAAPPAIFKFFMARIIDITPVDLSDVDMLGFRALSHNVVHLLNPADGPNADTINGFTTLGHYAKPADVAAAVAFLASPDGHYLNGATVSVDGGFTI
ncbi:hypothetical protein C8054_18930 [Micromonospora sp. RP3T]|nr:hypothetical protein C8054_18930 [Micromonospora sp. RP3T]